MKDRVQGYIPYINTMVLKAEPTQNLFLIIRYPPSFMSNDRLTLNDYHALHHNELRFTTCYQ